MPETDDVWITCHLHGGDRQLQTSRFRSGNRVESCEPENLPVLSPAGLLCFIIVVSLCYNDYTARESSNLLENSCC